MVRNILTTIIAMGLTERPVKDTSYLKNYDQHLEVALQTAREVIVLLKNENHTLPFRPKKGDVILVTGEYVDQLAVGSGAAFVDGFDIITLLDALKAQFGENVEHVKNPTNQEIAAASLAEIIAGVTNPSGKLPITIEKDFRDSPGYPYLPKDETLYSGWELDFDMGHPVHDVIYKEGVFTGYRWYEHKNIQPLYAFGHGLSYSTFEYANLKTNAEQYTLDDEVLVKVELTNTSEVDGKEIVQLYVTDLEATVERPKKELKYIVGTMKKDHPFFTINCDLNRIGKKHRMICCNSCPYQFITVDQFFIFIFSNFAVTVFAKFGTSFPNRC